MPLSTLDALPPNVQTALRDGYKLLAIKLLCEAQGIDMLTAKARIEAEPESKAVQDSFEPAVDALPPRVVAALRQGDKQLAVKTLREERNIGLREALDQIEAALGIEPEFGSVANSRNAKTDAQVGPLARTLGRTLTWISNQSSMGTLFFGAIFIYFVGGLIYGAWELAGLVWTYFHK